MATSNPQSTATPALSLVLLILCGLSLIPASARAADVSVKARLGRTQVQVGDAADLAVEVHGAQNAPAPAIASPDGLSIRYVGPSTQVSIVNGQMTASVTHRFSVIPLKEGTFTIGPIKVEYAGRQYDAGSVTLQVLAGAPMHRGQQPEPTGEQLRLVLSVPKSEVYLHERVPLGVKLYVGNIRVSDLQYPTVPGEGFALEKFREPQQSQERTRAGTFQVVDFQTLLTPLRSGTLTVGPAKVELSVLTRRRGIDPFFGRFFGSQQPTELRSQALLINVLPLPSEGRPADFSGAVGRFEFDVKAAPLDLQAGDPVTVTMTIRGTGNLENAAAPAIAASDTWRVYPVQVQPSTSSQEKVFEQVVIPQEAGALSLPQLRFSYFDPEARSYRTTHHAPIALAVRTSDQPQAAPQFVGAAPQVPTQAEQPLGRDIVFIKDSSGNLRPVGYRRYRDAAFWLFQPLPLVAWVAGVLYDRRRRRLTGNVRYARFTHAGREARRAIAGARDALRGGDQMAFFDALARAVSDYLAAKLDLPPGSVAPETVRERLRAQELAPSVADQVREFFATCERVRFAPTAASDGDLQQTLDRANAIVRALERERRLTAPIAGALSLACALSLGGSVGLAWPAPTGMEGLNTAFFRANTLYSEDRYAEAAAEYEKILARGRESGNLYFNLGNSYFKAGDIGHAILNYERALRLMPRDPDLHSNLSYARNLSQTGNEQPMYARLLFPLAERMTTDELLLTGSVGYTVIMVLLLLGRFAPRTQRITSRGAIASAVLLLVVLTSAGYRLATVDLPAYAVVVSVDDATVRFEPSANGTQHYAVKPGTVLRLLAERPGWVQVSRDDGKRGWVEADALAAL